jgi:hypothetical protein
MARRGRGPVVVQRNTRPGLVETMARTAVVAGTATAVSGAVSKSMGGGASAEAQQQSAVAQQQMADQQAAMMAQAQAAQAAAAPTGLTDEGIQKLKELASLKDAGIITEIEFEVQKAKILNG